MIAADEAQACCPVYPGAIAWFLGPVKALAPADQFPVVGQLSIFSVFIPPSHEPAIRRILQGTGWDPRLEALAKAAAHRFLTVPCESPDCHAESRIAFRPESYLPDLAPGWRADTSHLGKVRFFCPRHAPALAGPRPHTPKESP